MSNQQLQFLKDSFRKLDLAKNSDFNLKSNVMTNEGERGSGTKRKMTINVSEDDTNLVKISTPKSKKKKTSNVQNYEKLV